MASGLFNNHCLQDEGVWAKMSLITSETDTKLFAYFETLGQCILKYVGFDNIPFCNFWQHEKITFMPNILRKML